MKIKFLPLIMVIVLSIALFSPAFGKFYTHDDFFLLNISRVNSIKDYMSFYDLTNSPEGLGMYRPLSMQSFYMIAWLFGLNPLILRIISFVTFTFLMLLVYKFTCRITKDKKISLMTTFIYGVSSSHFSHLYFFGVYQELLSALFVIGSAYCFWTYLDKKDRVDLILCFLFFLLGILSKETALITPLILLIVYAYKRLFESKTALYKGVIQLFIFQAILVLVYLAIRYRYYGFPQGDSYVWDYSFRFVNTLFWYGLWSFNIPEMLVDFVGPGFSINIGPLVYWKTYIITSLVSFFVIIALVFYKVITILKISFKKLGVTIFGLSWFVITLLPVLFLPWHKFSYYLTLPLMGVAMAISFLTVLYRSKTITTIVILAWFIGSVANIKLMERSHWISTGPAISKKVYEYLKKEDTNKKSIVFYDSVGDAESAWKPSSTLKDTLSDSDFFEIFLPEILQVKYQDNPYNLDEYDIKLRATEFVK